MAESEARETGSHRKYDDHMARQIRRVADRAKEHRKILVASLVIGVAWVLAAAILDWVFAPMFWPKAIGLAIMIGWIAIYSKYLLPFRITVTCPSCNEQVNLNRDWICGWCGDEKTSTVMQNLVGNGLPLEPCKACNDIASAIACPSCKEEIVFDLEGYNQQPQYGAIRPGTAKFV